MELIFYFLFVVNHEIQLICVMGYNKRKRIILGMIMIRSFSKWTLFRVESNPTFNNHEKKKKKKKGKAKRNEQGISHHPLAN